MSMATKLKNVRAQVGPGYPIFGPMFFQPEQPECYTRVIPARLWERREGSTPWASPTASP